MDSGEVHVGDFCLGGGGQGGHTKYRVSFWVENAASFFQFDFQGVFEFRPL